MFRCYLLIFVLLVFWSPNLSVQFHVFVCNFRCLLFFAFSCAFVSVCLVCHLVVRFVQSELDATEYNLEVSLTELRAGVVEDESMNTPTDSKQQQRARQREQYNTQPSTQTHAQTHRERPEGATITPTTAAFSLSPGAPVSEQTQTKADTETETGTYADTGTHTQAHHTHKPHTHARDHGIRIAGLFCKATYSHDPAQSNHTHLVNPRRILRARAPASVPLAGSVPPSVSVPLSVPGLLTPQPSTLGLGALRLPAMTPTASITALPDVSS